MARQKRIKEPRAAAESAAQASVPPASIAMADVARRAYDLYLERGREPGHDLDDWLRAERELRTTASSQIS